MTAAQMQWYVARLAPGATREARRRVLNEEGRANETVVERSVREEGFDCYLPKMRMEHRHPRTKKMIIRSHALFTGYAFVAMPIVNANWAKLRACDGIADVLGTRGVYWRAPVEMIDGLRQMETDMAFDDTKDARVRRKQEGRNLRETIEMQFPVGTEIEATGGRFHGFHGQVASVNGRGAIKAMVELFGRLTPVEFSVDEVRKVA